MGRMGGRNGCGVCVGWVDVCLSLQLMGVCLSLQLIDAHSQQHQRRLLRLPLLRLGR